MVHPEHFVDAHRRHWDDAELLFGNSRWAVDVIWPTFAKCATSARGRVGAGFVTLLPSGTPFATWSVQNRYAHNRHFHRAVTMPHRKAAEEVLKMVRRAKLDGVL